MKFSVLSERFLLTLWVGSVWTVGYLAVPLAFATLNDTKMVGEYASKLFFVSNMLGLLCGLALSIAKIVLQGRQVMVAWRFWVIILMIVLTLIFSGYLQPEIALAKKRTDVAGLDYFATLHTVAENVFLAISLLGLALVMSTDKAKS